MTRTPLVSVVIPAYNYGRFLATAITSLLAQRYRSLEIIVVDDGSTDDTAAVLTQFPAVLSLRQENQGLPSARNRGLEAASGEYVLFLDADDAVDRDAIAARVQALERAPGAAFCVGRSVYFSDRVPGRLGTAFARDWPLASQDELDLALTCFNIAPPHAFLCRRAALQGMKFDPGLRACEDYDFWIRLALSHGLPLRVEDGRVFYRQHPGSMSRSRRNQWQHDAILCERNFRRFQAQPGWLGSRPAAHYALPMLAAVLVTARRLECLEAGLGLPLLDTLARPLLQCVQEDPPRASAPLAPYIAMVRHVMAKTGYLHGEAESGGDVFCLHRSLARAAMRESPPPSATRTFDLLRADAAYRFNLRKRIA